MRAHSQKSKHTKHDGDDDDDNGVHVYHDKTGEWAEQRPLFICILQFYNLVNGARKVCARARDSMNTCNLKHCLFLLLLIHFINNIVIFFFNLSFEYVFWIERGRKKREPVALIFFRYVCVSNLVCLSISILILHRIHL